MSNIVAKSSAMCQAAGVNNMPFAVRWA